MGIFSSFYNTPLTADSETGVLVDTHLFTETTPVHRDQYPADKDGKQSPVREDREVAFVFLNSNSDAYFQHGDNMSVPVVEGSLVHFNGRVAHNTVVNSGAVYMLGSFEVGPLVGSAGIIGGIGTSGCGSNEELFVITINLDSKAEETSWRIWDIWKDINVEGVKYIDSDSNSMKIHSYSADKNSRYEFFLNDSAGDGIEGSDVLSFNFGQNEFRISAWYGYDVSMPITLSCTVDQPDCNTCSTSQPSISMIPTVSMIPTADESGSHSISFVWTCVCLVISCLMVTF